MQRRVRLRLRPGPPAWIRRSLPQAVLGAASLLCFTAPLLGQASDDGMGQGEARIDVRSDVRLSIKGTRATTTDRLAQLTSVMTDQMPELRACYRRLVAKRPTTVGSLAIRVTLDPGKRTPGLEFKETGGTEPALTACVRRVLKRAPFGGVERPAAAIATLEFENSRAKGQAAMEQRMQIAARVDVRERPAGGFEATWTAADGKVSLAVQSDDSEQAVEAVLRRLRTASPSLADCRRRSEKGGLSPEGELGIELRTLRRGKARAKVLSSSVAHERAARCVGRALSRLRFEGAPAGERVLLRVGFSG